MNAKNTATIIEVTMPNSHCPECHKEGDASAYFSGLSAYRLALEVGAITCDMVAVEVETQIGSSKWALAEGHDYALRGTKPPHSIQRIIDADDVATE